MRQLKLLREENARLKKLVGELTLVLLCARADRLVFPSIRPRTRTKAWGKGCDLCLRCSTPLPVLLTTEVLSKVLS